jgi:hypothetical protein
MSIITSIFDHRKIVRGYQYKKTNGKVVTVKPHMTTVRVHHNKPHK